MSQFIAICGNNLKPTIGVLEGNKNYFWQSKTLAMTQH